MSTAKTLLLGMAGGLVAGILLAPEKGSRTRSNLTKKGEDILDSFKDKFDGLLDELSGKLEQAEKEIEGLHMKADKKADEIKSTVKAHNNLH